jgi:DNA-binding protein YbaB
MEMQKLFEGMHEIQRELKEMRHDLSELKSIVGIK